MHVALIDQDWGRAFQRLFAEAETELVIVSPFMGREPVETLCSALAQQGKHERVHIHCVVNCSPEHLLAGSVNGEAVLRLKQACAHSNIFHLGGLHAKVYIADRKAALITSANFTLGGWQRNREFGVWLEDAALVTEAYRRVRALWQISTPLSQEDLIQLARIGANSQASPSKGRTPRESKAIASAWEILVGARLRAMEESAELESKRSSVPLSENRIFAATILYLLRTKGPLTTQELHPLIQALHPELCDDTVERVIDGVRFGKRWKHMVRNAQQYLKRNGLIGYDAQTRRWFLRE